MRETVFEKFTSGERVDNSEGSLTRLSTKIFLKTLVDEHNSGGKHLSLHDPICLGFQYEKNVIFGCYSTVFLTSNLGRAIATGWELGMGFDSTGPISNTKFDTMGITTNSLGRRANPVCLSFVSQECAVAYTAMYDAAEAGLYQILVNVKCCKRDKGCEVCDSIRELREEQEVDAMLHPRKSKSKAKAPSADGGGAAAADAADAAPADALRPDDPTVFRLPLEKPLCDNTTKFSKFINKRLPHLKKKIGQCAAHLTGIAWQKKLHRKYFKNQSTYRRFYQLLVSTTRSSSVALSNVLQRKMIQWLRARGENRAAEWIAEYWTGDRGNWTLAHAGVGGTNNNNGTEGRWGGFKSAVAGTSGRSGSLSLTAVVPATLNYLNNVSKEQASYWAVETRKRGSVSTARFKFPAMPRPTPPHWAHVEGMHKWSLELCLVDSPRGGVDKFDSMVDMLNLAAPDLSLNLHERISLMYDYTASEGTACPLPGRNAFNSIIFPRASYLKHLDPDGTMGLQELLDASRDDILLFAEMMDNPAEFETAHADVPWDKMVRLHESFVLCEPNQQRWGRWGLWKCGCDGCFADGLCGHSLLLALLFDKTLKFPPEYSTKKLPGRKSTGRRPNAWCPEGEEDEEDPSAKQHWCPITVAAGPMTLKPKVRCKVTWDVHVMLN